jgi:hypothetical protein
MASINAKDLRKAIKQQFQASRRRWLSAMDAAWYDIAKGVIKHLTAVNDPLLFLSSTGEWTAPVGGGGGGISDGDKGDIVVSGSGAVWDLDASSVTSAKIGANQVTLDKIEEIATHRFLGNSTGGVSAVTAVSVDTLATLLPAFTATASGVVPASGVADGTKVLYDDATWASPPAGGSGESFAWFMGGC